MFERFEIQNICLKNEFVIKSLENCPGSQPIRFYITLGRTSGHLNHIQYSGYLESSREVNGPLELILETSRCDINMKKCEKFSTQKFTKVCHMFEGKNNIFTSVLATMQPTLRCPIKNQRYEAVNSSMDMTTLAYLPLTGSIFMSTAKLFSGESKKAEMVLCTSTEMRIIRARKEKKTKNVLGSS